MMKYTLLYHVPCRCRFNDFSVALKVALPLLKGRMVWVDPYRFLHRYSIGLQIHSENVLRCCPDSPFLGLGIKADTAISYGMSKTAAKFEQPYFSSRNYASKERLVGAHVLAVLRWASGAVGTDFLDGRGKRALDVGCALGFSSRVLAGLGYEVVGLDVSRWAVSQARERVAADFLLCDGAGVPFQNGAFDLVTCFDVLEHLPSPERAVCAMFAACRGALVCTTPNAKVEKPIRKLIGDYDETHVNAKSQSQWRRLIDENCMGASQVQVEPFHDFSLGFGGKLFFKSFRIPSFGLTVRIVVKK
jgi:2-polyprenyl-3-methyl-5-hydroxy-6-metoxy-1,4-benzoquinol methylase